MNARALLYSFSPKPNIPPTDTSAPKRSFGSDSRPQTRFRFRVRVQIQNREHYWVLRVSGRDSGGGKRRGGKVFADVKSEAYDISESVDKFEKGLNDVPAGKEEELEEEPLAL
ncbi:sodium-dependent phosphate transport protein 1 chloroplastic [Prunus yedoensis var. nudiflora]|uniref:Sodium-dependent phosphate transport protein 1 chloroplastic n=1 Tax=Prunus yedoensis var. nudiflora TaxID=2094558 RepID=A0A314XT57_PRUYE|nr:sodium-dependent phosphate transport protein 1 chloroplastic [Prunus yedoensis var. nudiflora]